MVLGCERGSDIAKAEAVHVSAGWGKTKNSKTEICILLQA